ncbi:hypothetical protein [Nesterenkonia marinintestina]|uniref:hypothetical protein n=1 Tax=Nesterenkonia marinintestina TaxID=2979865 RepID=UPI0021C22F3D|nr:hypothetical protein [Nesterenkonia sp. GX14115]
MTTNNVLDRWAERLVHTEGTEAADERERAVCTESGAFAASLTLYACLLGALASAVAGQVLVPLALLVVAMLPSYSMHWYCRRRGVEPFELLARRGRHRLGSAIFAGGTIVLTCLAMGYTVARGQGLVPVPTGVVFVTDGLQEAAGTGMALGAAAGAVLGVVAVALTVRGYRRRAEAGEPDQDPDEPER